MLKVTDEEISKVTEDIFGEDDNTGFIIGFLIGFVLMGIGILTNTL